MSKQKKSAKENPVVIPMTDEEMAVKHNQKELVNQLNVHFNGTDKQKKSALKSVDTAFDNLVEANKKAKTQ